jgi:hypothetical protein
VLGSMEIVSKEISAPRQSGLGFLDQMWKVRKDARVKEVKFFVHVVNRPYRWSATDLWAKKFPGIC